MNNPFVIPILSMLKTNADGLSEYEILRYLKTQFPEFCSLAEDAGLCLFRQHFLIMNALYQLQMQLWQEEGLKLAISPTHIQIHFTSTPKNNINVKKHQTQVKDSAEAKIISYYLDWSEYTKTNETEVEALLQSFFKGLHNPSATEHAYKTLKLHKNASYTEIKTQYRKLASLSHPDKGGSTSEFIELREAFELLSSLK